jgi:hypothetical protein
MATNEDFWTDPEMFDSGDYVKFDIVGDTVTGTITAIKRHQFDDGKVAPSLELDTPDGPKTLTAGQVRLKAALAEKRPGVGDHITITLTQVEKRAGGKTLKHFDVVIGPAPANTAAPVAAPAPAAAPVDAAAVAAAQAAFAAQIQTVPAAAPAAAPAFDPSTLTAEQLAALLAAKGVA